ncbi:unnamed protein product, partial [Effrenium voratum]
GRRAGAEGPGRELRLRLRPAHHPARQNVAPPWTIQLEHGRPGSSERGGAAHRPGVAGASGPLCQLLREALGAQQHGLPVAGAAGLRGRGFGAEGAEAELPALHGGEH